MEVFIKSDVRRLKEELSVEGELAVVHSAEVQGGYSEEGQRGG